MNIAPTPFTRVSKTLTLCLLSALLILPTIFFSCKELEEPVTLGEFTATIEGSIYGKRGTSEKELLQGALVAIRTPFLELDTLTNSEGRYKFVLQFPESLARSTATSISVSKSPDFILQTDNLIIRPGSEVVANFTLVSEDTSTPPPPSGTAAGLLFVSSSTTTLNVRGVGGNEALNMTFEVRDSSGIPIDSAHNVLVRFRLAPSTGGGIYLTPDSAYTQVVGGRRGRVSTTLRSGTRAGIVQIEASVDSPYSVRATSPAISIFGGLADDYHFSMSIERSNFPALGRNGIQNSVTVQLGDRWSNPVPTGTAVSFSTTAGIIQARATTDEDGRATTTLTSGDPQPPDGIAYVYGEAVGDSGRIVRDSIRVLFTGQSTIFPDDMSLVVPDGGLVQVPFRVMDQNRQPLASGSRVRVSFAGDALSELVFSGNLDVTIPETQDTAYTLYNVSVRDTSLLPSTSDKNFVMTVEVTSPNGNISRTYYGLLRGSGGIGGGAGEKPGSIILSNVSSNLISVRSTGSTETAVVTFLVRDRSGRPIPQDSALVMFELQGTDIGASLFPTSARTDAQGRVQTTLSSGTVAGVVQVVAATDTGFGQRVISTPVPISIAGGLPDTAHFTVAVEKFNIPGLLRAGLTDEITVYVGDRYGNPVQSGTAVYFTTNGGIIKPAAFTNTNGIASTTLISGEPNPPGGIARITASTISDSGTNILSNALVVFSGFPIISGQTDQITIQDGSSITYHINVSDQNGNPLSAGSTINVSLEGPNAGEVKLTGDVSTSLGDFLNRGIGSTDFYITLTDTVRNNLISGAFVLSINVGGPNGATRRDVPGTLLKNENPPITIIKNIALLSISDRRLTVRGTGETDSTLLLYEIQDSTGNAVPLSDIPVNFDFTGAQGSFNPRLGRTDSLGHVRVVFYTGSDTGIAIVQAQVGEVISKPQNIVILPGKAAQRYLNLIVTRPPDTTQKVNFAGAIDGLQQTIGQLRLVVKDRYGNPVSAGTQVEFSTNAGSVQDIAFTTKSGLATVDWFGGTPLPSGGTARILASVVGEGGARVTDSVDVTYSGKPVITGGLPSNLVFRSGIDTAITFSVRDANGNPLSQGTKIRVVASGAAARSVILTGDTLVTMKDTRDMASTNFTFRLRDTNTVVTSNQVLSLSVEVDGPNGTEKLSSIDTVRGAAPPPFRILALAGVSSSRISVTDVGAPDSTQLTYVLQDSAGHVVPTSGIEVSFSFQGIRGRFNPQRASTDNQGRATTTFYSGTVAETVKVKAQAQGINSAAQEILIEAGPPAQDFFAFALLSSGQPRVNFAGGASRQQIGEARVQVRDRYGNIVGLNTAINFSANAGSIQSTAYTDKDGVARVAWYGGAPYPTGGMAIVRAESRNALATILARDSAEVLYSGSPVIAGGIQENFILRHRIDTTISYSVLDANGNPLAQGTSIRVVASGSAASALQFSGDVNVTMPDTRDAGEGQFSFRMMDTNSTFTGIRDVQLAIQVSGPNGSVAQARAGSLRGAKVPTIAGLGLQNITATRMSVRDAGDVETSVLTYQLLDSLSNPLRQDSVQLAFSLEGVPGDFSSDTVMTNEEGQAQVLFRSGTVAGIVKINARVVGVEVYSPNLKLMIVGGKPAQEYFTFIITHPEGNEQKLNYSGAMPVVQKIGEAKVQTGDRYGNPVPAGTPIYFTTNSGVIQGSAFTDGNGFAQVDWFGGNPIPSNGTAVVRASALGMNGTTVVDSAVVTYSGQALVSGGPANGFQITGGGTASYEFTVADSRGNPPAEGTRIRVSALGSGASAVALSGDLDMTMGDTRDQAETNFAFTVRDTSTFSKTVRDLRLSITVTGPNGSVSHLVDGTLLPTGAGRTRLPGSIALISTSSDKIQVVGTGGLETSTMVFELRDSLGVPVDSGYLVRFALTPSLGGAFISPDSGVADPRTGRITSVIHAGTISGTIQVSAVVSTPNGDISSTPVRLIVHAGQPDQAHLSIGTSRLNLPGLHVNGDTATISVIVGDRYSNPVPPGTAVYFSTSIGVVTTTTGFTDDRGQASATLYTGNPRSDDGFGYVKVTTIGEGGVNVSDSVRVLFSGQPMIDSLTFLPTNVTDFTAVFRVSDVNGNPLSAGSDVKVVTEGNVSLNVSRLMPQSRIPDTQDPSWTYFAINFILNRSEDEIRTGPFTATITVEGPNGVAVRSFQGFVALPQDTTPPRAIGGLNFVNMTEDTISVQRTGGVEETRITYQLVDSLGSNLALAGVEVAFGNTGAIGTLVPDTAVTDASGQAFSTFRSGSNSGTAVISATLVAEGFSARNQSVTILPGQASTDYFSLLLSQPGGTNAMENFPGGTGSVGLIGEAQVRIGDRYGNPIPANTPVYLETNAGTIQSPVVTDVDGFAKANWFAGAPLPAGGNAVVTATVAGETGEVSKSATAIYTGTPAVSGGLPSGFTLRSGIDTTITFTVADANGNPLSQGSSILASLSGVGASTLNISGDVAVTLPDTRDASFTQFTIRIRDINLSDTSDLAVTFTMLVGGRNGSVSRSVVGVREGVAPSQGVDASVAGVSLISVSSRQLVVKQGGGVESSQLIYEIRDSIGNVIRRSGDRVMFASNGVKGRFSPETTFTDINGRAQTTFRSDTIAGVVDVYATDIASGVSSTTEQLTIVGGKPDKNHFTFWLSAAGDPTSERSNFPGFANGEQIGDANVLVGDRYGNPSPAGTAVYFTTNAGVIEGSSFTDVTGSGVASWLGGDPKPSEGSATVIATTIGINGIAVSETLVVTYSRQARILVGAPATFQMSRGGSLTVNYKVGDDLGNPLAFGAGIQVSTSAGSRVSLTGDIDITMGDTRDTNDTWFSFTIADTANSVTTQRSFTLTISVDGPNGSASSTSGGTVLAGGADTSRSRLPGSVALLSVSNNSIQVAGTGGTETSSLTYEVRDSLGTPVDSTYRVRFILSPPGMGGAFISPDSGLSDGTTGQITAVVHSGTVSGPIDVTAEVVSPGGVIRSSAVRILIHAGLPDQEHFSVTASPRNLPGLAFNGKVSTVSAIVGDQYSNPVPAQTAVYFSSSLGVVTTNTGFTNANGFTSVSLFTGNPRGDANGFGYVYANTIGENGATIRDSVRMLFSGEPIITPITTTFSAGAGGCATLDFEVKDLNGNPITSGSTISLLVSSESDFTTSNMITMSDVITTGSGKTYFTVQICDVVEETPVGSPATVSVVVVWEGQTFTQEIATGTLGF